MCLPVKPFKIEREWNHRGLSCAVVLNRDGGHRCGYVRVPPTHKLHGSDYCSVEVDVHGGLTFAGMEPCSEHEDGQGYWFGFDCAHAGDAFYDPENLPEHEKDFRSRHPEFRSVDAGEHYWSQEEVVAETNYLARQLAEMK